MQSFLSVKPLAAYQTPRVTYSRPQVLTSFSYSAERELLLGDQADSARAVYHEPIIPQNTSEGGEEGIDLRPGIERCVWRDETVDEGLDSLLKSLLYCSSRVERGSEMLLKSNLITWRGMVTRLFSTVYEAENASRQSKQPEKSEWEMNIMIFGDTLFIENSLPPHALQNTMGLDNPNVHEEKTRQTWIGYSFESLCTEPEGVVNTNIQWCSVVKSALGDIKMLLGGEVDCVTTDLGDAASGSTDSYVELKTNMTINSRRDEERFVKFKLFKHYIQSFLLGIPSIVVGFRTRLGILQTLQTFQTTEIPSIVASSGFGRPNPHQRGPQALWTLPPVLTSAHSILEFVQQQISQDTEQIKLRQLWDQRVKSNGSECPIEEFYEWPVFRLKFCPGGVSSAADSPVLVLERLTNEQVRDMVWAGKVQDFGKRGWKRAYNTFEKMASPRVGFLTHEWIKWSWKQGPLETKQQPLNDDASCLVPPQTPSSTKIDAKEFYYIQPNTKEYNPTSRLAESVNR